MALLDSAFQAAYWVAHRMLRAYWFVRNPETSGALVALWNDGEVLVVKNSYRNQYTLPGGYVHPGESPERAGARELREEVGIECDPKDLSLVYEGQHPFEFRRDALVILETKSSARPTPKVDNREVVWAGFKSPKELLKMSIVPHLREYLKGSVPENAGSLG
ncbi:MAG TPA: NUDIX hydrolase [Polyangiaceae bacterium]|jgi:8-oxo-dGTP pyrophosphatase MutT (NUDIX family)|nr:NUDIX hydrolase [Polyangiaceae bacterium]